MGELVLLQCRYQKPTLSYTVNSYQNRLINLSGTAVWGMLQSFVYPISIKAFTNTSSSAVVVYILGVIRQPCTLAPSIATV